MRSGGRSRVAHSSTIDPRRGEIWIVDLDPTKGAEMQKRRPVVVMSSDSLRSLPLRLVAPITGWQAHFQGKFSHVRIDPAPGNNLAKPSAVDVLQLRGVALVRFLNKTGHVTASEVEEIAAAIAAVIEYQ
jgi:mRNA interferase MazF